MESAELDIYRLTIHPTLEDREILQQVQRLCPPPEVALRVVKLSRDPEVEVAQLARCIELDPSLAAQVLQTVNSAQFGLSHRINSVPYAVSLLGFKSLRLMATAFMVLNPLSVGLPRALYQSFWKRSLTTAFAAREFAASNGSDECQVSFTTGLLSGIGVLAFSQVQGAEYHKIYSEFHSEPLRLVREERRCFGTDHIRIGGLLLGEFSLDSNIVHALLSLAVPEERANAQDLSPLSLRLYLAHRLSDALSGRDQQYSMWVRERFFQEFGLDTDGLLDLILRIRANLSDWADVFKLEFPEVNEKEFRAIAAESLAAVSTEDAVELSFFESFFG